MAQKKVNHVLHIILTVLTFGLWLLVYIPILIGQSVRNKREYREAMEQGY